MIQMQLPLDVCKKNTVLKTHMCKRLDFVMMDFLKKKKTAPEA